MNQQFGTFLKRNKSTHTNTTQQTQKTLTKVKNIPEKVGASSSKSKIMNVNTDYGDIREQGNQIRLHQTTCKKKKKPPVNKHAVWSMLGIYTPTKTSERLGQALVMVPVKNKTDFTPEFKLC